MHDYDTEWHSLTERHSLPWLAGELKFAGEGLWYAVPRPRQAHLHTTLGNFSFKNPSNYTKLIHLH